MASTTASSANFKNYVLVTLAYWGFTITDGALRMLVLNVGFYYMANSGGRLAGTVLSGLVYQFFGLVGCLWTSMFFVLAAGLITLKLPNPQPSKAITWKAGDGD
jgi:hypothetical protein